TRRYYDLTPVRQVQDEKKEFRQLVQTQSHKIEQNELRRLVDDITEQGKKIAHFRSFRDLAKFKRMIKDFLQKTVHNGLIIRLNRSFHANSFNQKLTTVDEIEE